MARVPNSGSPRQNNHLPRFTDADRASQPEPSRILNEQVCFGYHDPRGGVELHLGVRNLLLHPTAAKKVHSTEAGEPANLLAFASLGRNVMTISPCRRHDDDMFHVEQFALSAQNPRILVGVDRKAEDGVYFDGLLSAEYGTELPGGQGGHYLGGQFAAAGFEHLSILDHARAVKHASDNQPRCQSRAVRRA